MDPQIWIWLWPRCVSLRQSLWIRPPRLMSPEAVWQRGSPGVAIALVQFYSGSTELVTLFLEASPSPVSPILPVLCSVLVGNVGDMSATCRHEIHVLVILGQHANSADTNHQISSVASKFSVVVCTTSAVVMTNHNIPEVYCPHPFLMWWHTHAIHSSQTACLPGWIGWSWSCASRKRWELSTWKNYFIILSDVQNNTRPIRPHIVRRHGEDLSLKVFDE